LAILSRDSYLLFSLKFLLGLQCREYIEGDCFQYTTNLGISHLDQELDIPNSLARIHLELKVEHQLYKETFVAGEVS
jgi:hypothetical protein